MNRSLATFTPPAVQVDREWTLQLPTKAGSFTWRKNYQWEPIVREVLLVDGVLVAWSSSYEQYLPLVRLPGEWFLPDLIAQGALPAPKNSCVARRSIFRK